jgi:hypothetical protein
MEGMGLSFRMGQGIESAGDTGMGEVPAVAREMTSVEGPDGILSHRLIPWRS